MRPASLTIADGHHGRLRPARHRWVGGLISQNTTEFFGTLQRGHLSIELGIVGVLAVASAIILLLGYRARCRPRRFQEELAHLAYHDGLTGLANRSLFHDRLGQALARAKRHARTVAVLYLDLDSFKLVNDREGHDAGDAVLVEVGGRLRDVVRAEDTVARMGGDEFAIVMEEVEDLSTRDGHRRSNRRGRGSSRPRPRRRGRRHCQRRDRVQRRMGSPTSSRCCEMPTWRCTGPRLAARTGLSTPPTR